MYSPTYCPGGRPCKQKLTSHLERELSGLLTVAARQSSCSGRGERCVSTLPSQLPNQDPICSAVTSQPGKMSQPAPQGGWEGGSLSRAPGTRALPNSVCICLRSVFN